jgi:psp operon transcriptional activator
VVERAVFYADDGALIDAITIDPFASPWRPGQTAGAAPEAAVGAATLATAVAGDYQQQVADYEKRLLGAALAACKNHQKNTAQRLGLSYHQLRRLLKKHQLG